MKRNSNKVPKKSPKEIFKGITGEYYKVIAENIFPNKLREEFSKQWVNNLYYIFEIKWSESNWKFCIIQERFVLKSVIKIRK